MFVNYMPLQSLFTNGVNICWEESLQFILIKRVFEILWIKSFKLQINIFICPSYWGFNYKICYRPGQDNQVADALSWRDSDSANSSNLMILSAHIFHFYSQLQQENTYDLELQRLHKELSSNPTFLPAFKVVDGLLFHRGKLYIGPNSPLKHLLLTEYHSVPMAGHQGITKTLASMSASFS